MLLDRVGADVAGVGADVAGVGADVTGVLVGLGVGASVGCLIARKRGESKRKRDELDKHIIAASTSKESNIK